MAWRCSASSHSQLIKNLWNKDLIKDPRTYQAFLQVDRAHYAPHNPYDDQPQIIGHGATISAPHMHAVAVDHLIDYIAPTPNDPRPRRVLDIGSGSGYLTHVFAEAMRSTTTMMAESLPAIEGLVVGMEHIQALRDLGETNMRKSERGRKLLDRGNVKFVVGDGRKGWLEPGVPHWDAIHVGASATALHQELLDQLQAPGRIFIPIDDGDGSGDQSVWTIDKAVDGTITKQRLFGVRYVPLTDAP